ncbi:MAG TPA: tetratricopeptide repeat protein [Methanospirillum sp.]|nr:tetratricopeptide repeat protein [Methanospirillum sp.]
MMNRKFIVFLLLVSLITLPVSVLSDNDNRNVNLGVDLANQGKYEQALAAFNRQIDLVPGESERWNMVWAYKAAVLYKLGRYGEAKDAIDYEIQLDQFADKTVNGIINQIGLMFPTLGFSDAEGFVNEMQSRFYSPVTQPVYDSPVPPITSTSGDDIPVYDNDIPNDLIQSYPDPDINSDYSEHTPEYNEAAKYIEVGSDLQARGKLEDAIRAFDQAIEVDPYNDVAWNNKGTALVEQGQFDQAIAAFDQAVDINPNFEDAWVNKGIILKFQGKYDEAIEAFDRALEINPDNAKALKAKKDAEAKRDGDSLDPVKPDPDPKPDPVDPDPITPDPKPSTGSVTCAQCCEWRRLSADLESQYYLDLVNQHFDFCQYCIECD